MAPKARKRSSGRFVLRLDPKLHQRLSQQAEASSLSLNELCIKLLSAPWSLGSGKAIADWADVCVAARDWLGPQLIGAVLFGSVARGEARNSSDTDILFVLETEAPVTRELYSQWDQCWKGPTQIEAHFAQLPTAGFARLGFWAEVALDGVILFESDLSISRYLSQVRREIASGRLLRKTVHGQAYWVINEVA